MCLNLKYKKELADAVAGSGYCPRPWVSHELSAADPSVCIEPVWTFVGLHLGPGVSCPELIAGLGQQGYVLILLR